MHRLADADLSLVKTESTDPVAAGNELTYTITLANNGPEDAHNVVISEALTLPPNGVTVQSVTSPVGTIGGNSPTYTWTIDTVANGATPMLTVVLSVEPAADAGTDIISDTATIIALDEKDTNPDNDTVMESTSITHQVDLQVAKSETVEPATAGTGPGNLTHTVTVTNKGPSTATGVTLSEAVTVPSGTTIVSITPSGTTTYAPPNTTPGIWTVGGMNVGGSETLTVTYTVGPSTMPGTDIVSDTAMVTAANEERLNTGDDTATEATSVLSPSDVSATKVKEGGSLISDVITYHVELTNYGPADQFDNPGPDFVDVLPDQLALVSATANKGLVSVDLAANKMQWNGVIPVGETVAVDIAAKIIKTGWVINQADVNYDENGDGTNNGSRLSDDPNEPGDQDPTRFYATAPVPVFSAWGLALLLLLLMAAGTYYLRRRSRAA